MSHYNPTSMGTIQLLVKEIKRYCRRHKMALTTFGRNTVNDGKLVRRLEEGGGLTIKNLEKVRAVLDGKPASKAA